MRRARQDLAALFGSIGRPGFSTVVFWGCAALAYPLATKGGYAGAVAAAIVFALTALFLAYVLGSGALAFAVDAKRSCLPGWRQLARRANLFALVLLLPALVLTVTALAANPVWPAWVPPVLVVAIAVAGALAPRQPASALGLFLLAMLAAYWTASGRGDHQHGNGWRFAFIAAAIVLLAAAIPLLAAVKWRRVIRRDSRSPSLAERDRTIAAMVSSRHGTWEPHPPVQIIRTCLGGMFAQLPLQLTVGAVLLALFIVAAIGQPWLGASGWHWAISILGLAAAGVVSTAFLAQLAKLTRGQIAELALMPGLGAPAAQRRGLCRAVLATPLLWLGAILLLGCADLLLEREPFANVGMLAVCLVIMWLTYTVYALQKLATLPPKRQSFISQYMLLYVVVYGAGNYYWLYTSDPQFHLWFWFWITPALVIIGYAGLIGFALRRLALAPHPFLA